MQYDVVYPISDDLYNRANGWLGFTLYHTRAWHQVLENTFGWRVQALVGRESGEIVSYLPFVRKRRLTKIKNVALPLSHRVGFARHPDYELTTSPPHIDIEVHAPVTWENTHQNSAYFVTKLNLASYIDTETLLKAFHRSSIQRKIKKAQKSDLSVISDVNPSTLDSFTRLQALTRRRQGSPTYPRHFFHHMASALGDRFHLYVAYQNDSAVAGIIFLYDGQSAIYGYGASTHDNELMRSGMNQLVMWAAIKHAYDIGLTEVDFGLTPNHHQSLRKYKEKWGGVSEPLVYTYVGTEGNLSRDSRFVTLVSSMLQRLPYPLFKAFSPLLLREVV